MIKKETITRQFCFLNIQIVKGYNLPVHRKVVNNLIQGNYTEVRLSNIRIGEVLNIKEREILKRYLIF